MNRAQKAVMWLAEKAYNTIASFSTTNPPGQDFYTREGYYGLARALYGYGERNAIQSAAVFGCIKILGEDVGSLPLEMYRRVPVSDGRVVAVNHPLYELLHNQPNPYTSAMEFREAITAHASLCGNGYARIGRNGEGRIVALWQLMPSDVKRDTNPLGTPFYRVRDARGIETSIPASDMFVLRGFGLDGEGVNILEVAKATIGLTVAQTEYAARFFSQDQTPPIIVKFPQKMGPSGIENFKAAWRKWHQGPDRWHEPGVIQEGGEVQQLLPTAEQAQLIEQRRFQIGEVCRLFRMPPHKLADLERATFSNIENMNRHYYTETLRPWLVRWEQAIRRQLIAPDEQPIYYAEHTIEGLLRGDFKTQTDGFSRLLEKGVYSINEVRALLNLNPIEDGDKHYIQLNMQAVADAATGAVVAEGTKTVPVGKPYVNGSPMDAAISRQN